MLEGGGLLFIIEPQMTVLPSMTGQPLTGHGTFLRQEMERIITWVSEGNSLVLAVSGQTELHERLGVTVESGAPCRRRNALRVQLSPLTRSLGRIES